MIEQNEQDKKSLIEEFKQSMARTDCSYKRIVEDYHQLKESYHQLEV
jgi:hypothetical protein